MMTSILVIIIFLLMVDLYIDDRYRPVWQWGIMVMIVILLQIIYLYIDDRYRPVWQWGPYSGNDSNITTNNKSLYR